MQGKESFHREGVLFNFSFFLEINKFEVKSSKPCKMVSVTNERRFRVRLVRPSMGELREYLSIALVLECIVRFVSVLCNLNVFFGNFPD